jgi:tetratricopeptide (TPR) repeat protein
MLPSMRALTPALIALVGVLLAPLPARAGEPPALSDVEQAQAGLVEGQQLVDEGRPDDAVPRLKEALELLGPQGDRGLRLALLATLGVAHAEAGRAEAMMAAFAEAIGLADHLSLEYPSLPVVTRLQLAMLLRDLDRAIDAEAAAWDALDVAIARGELAEAAAPVELLVLSAVDQGADHEQLAALVQELDLALSALDAYRLHVSPPPEPIAAMLEEAAIRRAHAGQLDAALEAFSALHALDVARGAEHRLVHDLSQLAWSALQAGDLRRAREALEATWDFVPRGDEPVDWLASYSGLLFEEGRIDDAVSICDRAARRAGADGDTWREAMLLGRLGRLFGHAGDAAEAVEHHGRAALRFDELGAIGEAALERSMAALALAVDGDLDAAEELRVAAVAELGEERLPGPMVEVRAAIDERRALAPDLPRARALELLVAAERGWFQQERAERLLDAALWHVAWAIEDGVGVEEAVAAIVALEEQTGLALEGWQGAWARGLAAEGDARRSAWLEAADRLDRFALLPLPDGRAPGEPPLPPSPWPDPREALLQELTATGRLEEAIDRVERRRALELAALARPESPTRLTELRKAMRYASFRGGERTPAEIRAELTPLLEQQIEAHTALPAGLDGWRPPAGTVVLYAFEVGEQVHLVLIEESGFTRLAEPDAAWIARVLDSWRTAPEEKKCRKRRKRRDEVERVGLGELGHLFGKVAGRLADAERILWIPDGPLRDAPLAEIPLPDGRPIGDVAEVVTARSIAAARSDESIDVSREGAFAPDSLSP